MSIANKILICLCCSQVSCIFASFYDYWASTEAFGLGCLNCAGCCWTVFAPICHTCNIGDFGLGGNQLIKGAKYCIYATIVSIIGPLDGIINCLLYNKKNFQSGVTGVADITQNCKFIAKKIQRVFDISGSNQPHSTAKTFTP